MSIDAMKTALEALEMLAKWEHPASNITTKSGRIYPHHVAKNSAATLRLAIEQAEKQEPYGYFRYDIRLDAWVQNRESDKGVPFYTDPPQRQPLTEIAEALRRHGLTLVQTAKGYEVMRLGEITAHGIGGEHE